MRISYRFLVMYTFVLLTVYIPRPLFALPLSQNATPVATLAPYSVQVLKAANLRTGPATTYKVAGSVKSGQTLTVTGRNSKGDWLQLSDGKWIAAFLVKPTTAKAILATATPTPKSLAAKPTPTVPAKASPSAITVEETLYVSQIGTILKNYTSATVLISTQFTAAGKDPTLIFDTTWKLQVAAAFATINLASEQLEALTPPARLDAYHTKMLEAAAHYKQMVSYASKGIDGLDADLILLANTEMETAVANIVEASALLDEFKAAIGL